MILLHPSSPLFPYTTLFRSLIVALLPGSRRSELQHMGAAFLLAAHRFRQEVHDVHFVCPTVTRETRDMFERAVHEHQRTDLPDRKSTRLNSSHLVISYAVFC